MALVKQLLVRSLLPTFKRSFSSALYITGDKAHNTFAVLTPVLDFDERLENRAELVENLKLRSMAIDLKKVEKRWNFYKYLDEQKVIFEHTRLEIGNRIAKLIKEEKNDKEMEQLKLHGKMVKEDLKVLRDYLYGVEEAAALHVLALPNILHEKTPHKNEFVVHNFLEKPNAKSKFHMHIGTENNLIEYTNPFFYFLKDDAALFELAMVDYISDILLKSSFSQFSNSDFSRSIIVEGCGVDFFDKLQVFTLEEIHNDTNHHEFSQLHLTGGASLYSFMAYFTKHSVQQSYFPLKLFSAGRRYQPAASNDSSLFNVSQETAVQIFVATKDDNQELENEFKKLVSQIIEIYEPFGHHFRLVYLPANNLKIYESLRLSIQMFSSYLQQYVEVGHCSIYDSYLSKRLLFTYPENKEWRFPKVISGTLLRIQPLLACALEYNDLNNNTELLPSNVKKYVLLD